MLVSLAITHVEHSRAVANSAAAVSGSWAHLGVLTRTRRDLACAARCL